MLARVVRLILRVVLWLLEKVFVLVREGSSFPAYPYDRDTNTISLPADIQKEIRQLVSIGSKPEAVRRVSRLTGAGLRLSKDYVDGLVETRRHR